MRPVIILLVVSLACLGSVPDRDSLRHHLKPFDLSKAPGCSISEAEYFRFYGIDIPDTRHWIGSYQSGPFTIAAQMFEPDSSRGTVVFLHGYYDHVGQLRHIIRESLQRKYSFAAIDLPGHGLSSGTAASIDDFAQYRGALRDFVALLKPHAPPPLVLAGHSMGCSVVYDYCVTLNDTDIVQVVLAAPLVRNAYWHLGTFGHHLARPFFSNSRRWYRNSSHDTAYLAFQRKDPLGSSTFPLAWANALYTWERRIKQYEAMTVPTVIIQGDHDGTVDWKFNVRFLKSRIADCTIHMLHDARHHLINEGEPYRSRFMELFFRSIEMRE
ncbi:MAG: alpha/beta hydrolase [Chitinispirillaceae bacterium]|nr:alpha/beta hydrolase [Chitinispirillaceae bacterium]